MANVALRAPVAGIPVATMNRLHAAGYSLLPLGGGNDGKSPSVAFKDRRRLPLAVVIERMQAVGTSMYGIRLAGLVIVDCDTDNEATRTVVRERFGLSAFSVRTPRGRHFYYAEGAVPGAYRIRSDGVAIDIKRSANSFVVGPGSTRPDGGRYAEDEHPLGDTKRFPPFIDRHKSTRPDIGPSPGKVAVGERYFAAKTKARELVEIVDSVDELHAALRAYATDAFADPASYTDDECRRLSDWMWRQRLNNNLWQGEMAATKVRHCELDRLLSEKGGADALALLHVLRRNHGAVPGKLFSIVAQAMEAGGVIPGWKASRYQRAKNLLRSLGLVRLSVKANTRARKAAKFQLGALGRGEHDGGGNTYIPAKYGIISGAAP